MFTRLVHILKNLEGLDQSKNFKLCFKTFPNELKKFTLVPIILVVFAVFAVHLRPMPVQTLSIQFVGLACEVN
jgi:hypothetical protein